MTFKQHGASTKHLARFEASDKAISHTIIAHKVQKIYRIN